LERTDGGPKIFLALHHSNLSRRGLGKKGENAALEEVKLSSWKKWTLVEFVD
jgi:hypothetical protein